MFAKFIVNLIVLIPVLSPTGADYGMEDISNYRLNDDMKKFPVRSPDDLFGFEVPPNTELNANNNNNHNQNTDNQNQYNSNIDYNEYLDQNNVMRPQKKTPPKKVRKNKIKSHRKPIQPKPMPKMIFSQYMSPHMLESDESYPLNPMDTFNDQYLAQLMPHIISTAEQMAVKQEEQSPPYVGHPVIPPSKLLDFFRSQHFYDVSDDPYGMKRSDKV